MQARFHSEVNPRLKQSLEEAFTLQMPELKTISTQINSRFMKNEKALFASEGASGGSKWPPLKPKYKRWKARRFPGRKILQRTGELRKSLTARGGGHVHEASLTPRAHVTVGTTVDHGRYHVPKRDPLQMTAAQEAGLNEIVSDYIIKIKLRRVLRQKLADWKVRLAQHGFGRGVR